MIISTENTGKSASCRSTPRALCALSTTVALLLAPAVASARANDSTFAIGLGVFLTDQDTDISLNGDLGQPGTPIDFESDLGLDNSDTVFRLDSYWRFNNRHRLDLSVFDLSRSGSRDIDREIEWNGEVYPVDTTVSSSFEFTIYKLAYTYSLVTNDKGYLGIGLGFYVADIAASLEAENVDARGDSEITAPLPVIGLRGSYELMDRLSFRASAEVFSFEYGDFDGALYDVYAGLDYQLFDHVALGVGYNAVDLDVEVSKPRFNGNLEWAYEGASIYAKFDF